MIGPTLRVSLILALIVYFVIILKFLKDKALSLKYSLLWIACGFVMLVLAIFPRLMSLFAELVGIQSSMNALFILCIASLIIISMSLTSIVSRQNNKIRILIQELAILEKRIRELEGKND